MKKTMLNIFKPKKNDKFDSEWTMFEDTVKYYGIDLEKALQNEINTSIELIHTDITRFDVRFYYSFDRYETYHHMSTNNIISLTQTIADSLKMEQLEYRHAYVLSGNIIEIAYHIVASWEPNTKTVSKPIHVDEIYEKAKSMWVSTSLGSVIGVDENELPIILKFDQTPHCLVGGALASGKTNFAKQLLLSMMTHYTSDEVRFTIIKESLGEYDVFKEYPHIDYIFDRPDQKHDIIEYLRQLNKSIENNTYHQTYQQIILVDELWNGESDYLEITHELIRLMSQNHNANVHVVIMSSIFKRLISSYPSMDDIQATVYLSKDESPYTINDVKDRLKMKGRFLFDDGSNCLLGQMPYINNKIIKQ